MSPDNLDRRKSLRLRSDDVVRWKRPGRVEDHKAWTIDRAVGGIGFCTLSAAKPQVGEMINLRIFDRDRWMTIERAVRVVRTDPTPGGELVVVGCAIAEQSMMATSCPSRRYQSASTTSSSKPSRL